MICNIYIKTNVVVTFISIYIYMYLVWNRQEWFVTWKSIYSYLEHLYQYLWIFCQPSARMICNIYINICVFANTFLYMYIHSGRIQKWARNHRRLQHFCRLRRNWKGVESGTHFEMCVYMYIYMFMIMIDTQKITAPLQSLLTKKRSCRWNVYWSMCVYICTSIRMIYMLYIYI